jgi:DNA helicase-2/ATP-dependent DNA helicase PcrA
MIYSLWMMASSMTIVPSSVGFEPISPPPGDYTSGMPARRQKPAADPQPNEPKPSTANGVALFDGLTEPQIQAVSHVDGPLLVLAGPGSGKTTVVTRRVAYLISQGIPPWQILALTFTNKAAGEMRERIVKMLPENLPGRRGLTIATFHSFCARLLRRYAPIANLSPQFTIYDSGDQRDAIKMALKEAGLDSKNFTPGSMASAISSAKNQLMDAAAYAQHAGDFYSRSIARVFSAYEKTLKRNDALDFDDLLLITAKLLKSNQGVREELQRRFQYIMIDEYQDTNHAQFVIAHSLAASHTNICVVGDPDQSIYGWRGADIQNILEFEKHYPSATIIPLGQNFRSTGHIVETAAKLIANNRKRKAKRLHTELGEGEKPMMVTCWDEHSEAALIVDEFRKRHGPPQEGGSDTPWREMAVLYRINALSRVMEEAFRSANIPYVIARGTAFYERKEIKDALSYLRLVANPNDEVSLRRIINAPPRGIGASTLDKIEIFAINNQIGLFEALRRANGPGMGDLTARAQNAIAKFVATVDGWREAAMGKTGMLMGSGEKAAFAELVERIIKESGLEAMYRQSKSEEDIDRLQNLEELINAAAEFSAPPQEDDREDASGQEAREPTVLETLQAYLESVALVSDADAIDPANGAVTLMTLHAAKGLEFEAVAIAGLEEGMLPHSRAFESEAELEEERRLCFVGVTRAKRHLLITRAGMRTVRGLRERTIPSQFLRELPEESIIVSEQAGAPSDGWDEDDFGSPRSSARGDQGEWGRSSWDATDGLQRSSRRSASTRGLGGGGGAASKFPVGCIVNHPKFGLGRVEIVTPRATGSSVQVAFNSVGRKTLIVEYAKLERVE